jgi:hypothetical protein
VGGVNEILDFVDFSSAVAAVGNVAVAVACARLSSSLLMGQKRIPTAILPDTTSSLLGLCFFPYST